MRGPRVATLLSLFNQIGAVPPGTIAQVNILNCIAHMDIYIDVVDDTELFWYVLGLQQHWIYIPSAGVCALVSVCLSMYFLHNYNAISYMHIDFEIQYKELLLTCLLLLTIGGSGNRVFSNRCGVFRYPQCVWHRRGIFQWVLFYVTNTHWHE